MGRLVLGLAMFMYIASIIACVKCVVGLGCVSMGVMYPDGGVWSNDPCQICVCENGISKCRDLGIIPPNDWSADCYDCDKEEYIDCMETTSATSSEGNMWNRGFSEPVRTPETKTFRRLSSKPPSFAPPPIPTRQEHIYAMPYGNVGTTEVIKILTW